MDVTYLQRAALAGALLLPIAAVGAVVLSEGDERERVPCPGCGEHGCCAGDAGLPAQESEE